MAKSAAGKAWEGLHAGGAGGASVGRRQQLKKQSIASIAAIREPSSVMSLLLGLAALVVLVVVLRRRWPPQRDLRGKVVLVTGAAGGLGRLMSLSLARRGCRLACVDVAAEPNEGTAALVREESAAADKEKRPADGLLAAKAYTVDLSQRDQIAGLVQRVIQDFGCVDILVSNAGVLQGGKVCEITDDELDLMLDVNLRATMLLARALLPHMKRRRSGHIVATSSVAAAAAHEDFCVYAATKAGLSHYMECLYRDIRSEKLHKDILVTVIHPFFMNTYDRLVNSLILNWMSAWAFPLLDARRAADRVVRAIAGGEQVVFIPDYFFLLANFLRLIPRSWRDLLYEYLLPASARPPVSYQYRHKAIDADLLYDLLSKGYPLEEDPRQTSTRLYDEFTAKGKSLPHDFGPYVGKIESYYRARRESVPDVVRRVFGLGA